MHCGLPRCQPSARCHVPRQPGEGYAPLAMAREMNPCPAAPCHCIDSSSLMRTVVSALWVVTESDPAETSVQFVAGQGVGSLGCPSRLFPGRCQSWSLCKGKLQGNTMMGPLELAVPLGDLLTATGARQSPVVLPKRRERFETDSHW